MKFKVRVVSAVFIVFMLVVCYWIFATDLPEGPQYQIYDAHDDDLVPVNGLEQKSEDEWRKNDKLQQKNALKRNVSISGLRSNLRKRPPERPRLDQIPGKENPVIAKRPVEHPKEHPDKVLPEAGKDSQQGIIDWFLERYSLDWDYTLTKSPWQVPQTWVTSRQLHPEHVPEIGAVLREMSRVKIIGADVGHKGTQLKLLLTLEGGQKVVFKPKWYEREYLVTGKPYDGKDRHNAEIVAFHLNRMLGLRRVPLAVGRVVDLENEIKAVGTQQLLRTFFTKDENTCFYGKCMYCKTEADGVCADGNILEGTVILWLPPPWTNFRKRRHPWARTYVDSRPATWEVKPEGYCQYIQHFAPYNQGPLLMDIMDASVFDYLIGNADRHHYETFKDRPDSMLVMLDNGKSFGNPEHDEKSILAPVAQCCLLRQSTWERLQLLTGGVLSTVLRTIVKIDPISPLLTDAHYQALDRRLYDIIDLIEDCIAKHSIGEVLMKDKQHSPKS